LFPGVVVLVVLVVVAAKPERLRMNVYWCFWP
jgi:hypothetical protein